MNPENKLSKDRKITPIIKQKSLKMLVELINLGRKLKIYLTKKYTSIEESLKEYSAA